MESAKKHAGVSGRGNDLIVLALKTVIVGFVALLIWDWFESGDFDPVGVGSNALAVAVGLVLVDFVLMWKRS